MLYELLYKSLSEMEGFFYLLMYIKAKGRLLKLHFTSCYALHFQIFKLPHFQIVFPFYSNPNIPLFNCLSILSLNSAGTNKEILCLLPP